MKSLLAANLVLKKWKPKNEYYFLKFLNLAFTVEFGWKLNVILRRGFNLKTKNKKRNNYQMTYSFLVILKNKKHIRPVGHNKILKSHSS